MKKIFCFGDGFATGHIWPEWPQILEALVPNYEVVTTAGVGAGTEFLVSGFVDLINKMKDSTIIFQWPMSGRFDKLLEDDSWQPIIDQDPVYHFNVNTDSQGRKWWLSSRSSSSIIKDYHARYIQNAQHARRQQIYKQLVSNTAANLNCCLVHTETTTQDIFSKQKRFQDLRLNEVQPAPLIHLRWLAEEILPQTSIAIDSQLVNKLEKIILQTHWIAYDPDRKEIWENIIKQLHP